MAANPREDIVDLLLAQHRQLDDLCDDVRTATDAHRERLFGELDRLLHTHETGEQRVVHPVTRDRTMGGDAIGRSCAAEEKPITRAMTELRDLGTAHPAFAAKYLALHRAVLDHNAHEERDEFPRLRRYVPAQRLHMMAQELRDVQTMG